MENPKFQLLKSAADGQFYYRLRAENGEIILRGEGFVSKLSCLKSIAAVKSNAAMDNRYERKDGRSIFAFSLKAANGEVIGTGESYPNTAARENGIYAVKRDAATAPIEELIYA